MDFIARFVSTVADILVLGIGARTYETVPRASVSEEGCIRTRHGLYVAAEDGEIEWVVPDHYVTFGSVRTGIAAAMIASIVGLFVFMFMCIGTVVMPFIMGSIIFFAYFRLNKPIPESVWKGRRGL